MYGLRLNIYLKFFKHTSLLYDILNLFVTGYIYIYSYLIIYLTLKFLNKTKDFFSSLPDFPMIMQINSTFPNKFF